jgi:putative zinc finger protein
MSETFECGDTDALVAYLYEECEPEEREVIAAHLVLCASCSSEIEGLGWTRRRLAAWAPPTPELGFRIAVPAVEPRLPWWRAPLPAWAQAVAAVAIFGVGLSLGLARGPVERVVPVAASQPAVHVTEAASRTDLSQLEQRLKSEMAQMRVAASTAARQTTTSDEDIMKKVEALVAQSEERQRREFTLRSVDMARELEAQRRVDLASVRQTVGQFQGVAGTEIRQQREAIDRINNFIRVSQGR